MSHIGIAAAIGAACFAFRWLAQHCVWLVFKRRHGVAYPSIGRQLAGAWLCFVGALVALWVA